MRSIAPITLRGLYESEAYFTYSELSAVFACVTFCVVLSSFFNIPAKIVVGSSPCREVFFLVPRTKLFKDNNCGAFANGSVCHFTVRVSVIPTILSPQKSKPLQSRWPFGFEVHVSVLPILNCKQSNCYGVKIDSWQFS